MAQNDQALNVWLIHVVNPMPYKHIYIYNYINICITITIWGDGFFKSPFILILMGLF